MIGCLIFKNKKVDISMTNIEKILNKFNGKITYDKNISSNKNIITTNENSLLWKEDVLPVTNYIKNPTNKNLSKIEEISKIKNIKPKKLVEMITIIDLLLIKNVTPKDLIEYDGNKTIIPIEHIQNKNKGLLNWLNKDFDNSSIFKMLKYSLLKKNYNLINILLKSLQSRKLSNKEIEKMIYYKKILDQQESGIFPFDWILKDSEDSNVNVNSEIASMRFCKIIDKLNEMKKIEIEKTLREKHKQFIYGNIFSNINHTLEYFNIKESNALYLLL